jgi:hypothetical protein
MPALNGRFTLDPFIRLWLKAIRAVRARFYAVLSRIHPHIKGCGQCAGRIPDLSTRFSGMPEPVFPVDAVVTWVNGTDPEYGEKIRQAQKMFCPGGRIEAGRYRDNGELRYSLRALNSHAPWLRTIHLVTDGQRPAWLRADHPKIRVTDHREFIPAEFLPTFNSHVIEAFLHRLPGLAEHYIYFNDDVFLGRPARKADFFTPNGLPLCFIDWRPLREFGYGWRPSAHNASWRNVVAYLQEKGLLAEQSQGFITAHGPFPQTIANALDAFAFYKDVIKDFAANRFRTLKEAAFYCHAAPMWLYGQKRIVLCDERYYYVQNGQMDRAVYYKALLASKERKVPPLFFCVNDNGNAPFTSWQRKDLRDILHGYFRDLPAIETEHRPS